MIKWAIIFAIIAVVAGLLGFSGIASGAASIAKVLFGLAVVIFLVLIALAIFGINALGSYVHSNRLEFVEFFGKFYEGGGRKFSPLGIHTKYYKIIEEETHVFRNTKIHTTRF